MDERLLLWINQDWAHPLLDGLFWWVSQRPWFSFPLAALLLADSVRRCGWRTGGRTFLLLAVTVAAGDALGNLLKDWFAEPRPCLILHEQLRSVGRSAPGPCGAELSGMPSNHALNFAAAATFVALATPWRGWRIGLLIGAVLVGLSRVYLGKHYPSQVFAGALIGAFVGWLAAWLATRCRAMPALPSPIVATPSTSSHPATIAMNPDCIAAPPSPAPTAPAGVLPPHRLSVVVPLYNERDNVAPLLAGIHDALAHYPCPWELIVVDDGSSDGTDERLSSETGHYGPHVHVLGLQRNFGQTAAMQAGIDAARGDVIATLDGDLQNDPADLPRLVERLLNGHLDLVVGWRQNRQDNVWLRTIPSHLANRLIGKITGVRLHDYGCSLKVYRASVIKEVRLYGEMHRFIPAWMSVRTKPCRIQEEVVHHRPRLHGESKYGLSRTFRVLVDLLSVYFFQRFLTRPGHFFGRIGLVSGTLGAVILLYLFAQKLFLAANIGARPLLLIGVLLVLMAIQFLTTGVLSELITRTYFASGGNRPYAIRSGPADDLATSAGWYQAHE
ncbi:MAG: Undecaprenyl-phosphate 4-deoxy-4-formamido-L-arabinose transferase [Candidatus Accumulibacter adjunctus]|uniref:Undecaprenyl-phosphate 4-deoxy-4-formamido-L-arabinose transferase n=1 Tax=Candidatus Accumulibacter adjunctus TaxID=1454001 RepID=A0A011PGZ8_9PROT|nr:MAG: Undecaprenyl-phosphate 4-deoxy-4-formamido-L-arabinose transferase [Candidatus Accumulibacter adjunctus]